MTSIKIGTLNTRGGSKKIDLIVSQIKKFDLDIIAFQETHEITAVDKIRIEKQVDGILHLGNGTTSSRGVATFIKNREGISDASLIRNDSSGRILISRIKRDGEYDYIVNVYAPNDVQNRDSFYREIEAEIVGFDSYLVG